MSLKTIQGAKGGSSSAHTPVEQADDLLSIDKLKMLVAVAEGEVEGTLTPQNIFLNDTPLANTDGSYNFTGVKFDFRAGTQDQTYIQGMPEIDNELSVGINVKKDSPWTRQFTNLSLDAVRLKLSLPVQYQYKDNGDMVGTVTEYAIDLSTDGGSWEMVVSGKFDGKTTSEYQRDHRINLPAATAGWSVRVRRITDDSTDSKLVNAFKVFSFAEVIDSKLRYPNSALLYIETDAEQFSGSAPKVTSKLKGKIIRVPDNYDPETRTYTGAWSGGFKFAYSNNPAWVFHDIAIDTISGLGTVLDASMTDKWYLYQVGVYCDQMVSNGAGGTEPRFTCNVFIQSQEDAYTVLTDLAAIFRGITFWGNDQLIVTADTPVDDLDWTYTAANVIDGIFTYAGGSYKNRYTSCQVSYSDPQNHYADTVESVYEPDLVARYGVNEMTLTAIGCTSQSEANRRGRWALLSNSKDGTVSFSVGLDGHIPLPASVIGVADPYRAGKQNGGRLSSVNGNVFTLDRAVDFAPGDRLILNLPDGTSQTRTIGSIGADKKTVTVNAAYSQTPAAGAVWVIDSDNLAVQQFRVTSVSDNGDGTFTVTGVQYDPNKFAYIDDGVKVQAAPVTVTPTSVMAAPGNITVKEVSHISQGISVSSLQVSWDAVKGAVKYSAQWRRDSGDWINTGTVSSQGFTVSNIYAGVYEVRVRAINSSGISSPWGTADAVTLTGKQGKPPVPVSLKASDNTVFGIDLSWGFGTGSDDGLKTTIMVSTLSDHSDETLLADIPYPQSTYSMNGLASGVIRYFRAAFTDKSGNQSDWTDYVKGQSSSSASDVLSYISGEISKTDLAKDLTTEIDAKADQDVVDQQISGAVNSANSAVAAARKDASDAVAKATADANAAIAEAKKQAQDAITEATANTNAALNDANNAISRANTTINTEIADRITAVNNEANARADAILNEQNARTADISTVKTLIQNGDKSLAQQISQVAAGSGDQFDTLNIWYFDDKSSDGWTSSGGTPVITADGWMTPAASNDAYVISPSGLGFNSTAYRFIKLRVRKQGTSKWEGELRWKKSGAAFDNTSLIKIPEPVWDANNTATITVNDIAWTGTPTIDQIRLDLTTAVDSTNYIQYDWIAIGRPTPGAGMAALQSEQTARVEADAAEATQRNTLAVQVRGPYTGTDASQVTSGLIYSEKQLRISGDKAEATARQTLETKLDNSVSTINKSLDTLNTSTQANASDITGLKSSLQTTNNTVANKADASAVNALTTKVNSQGDTISSQGSSITSLNNSLNQVKSSGPNLVIDSGFESYTTTSGSLITDGAHHAGSKSVKFIRVKGTNTDGNQDQDYGGWFDLRSNQVLYIEIWCRQDQKSSTQKASMNVGIHWQNSTGSNYWPVAFQVNFSELSSDNSWKKFSGYVSVGNDAVKGTFWIAIPQSASNLQGSSLLIDDVFVGDATDGYNAQKSADAAASAVSSLQNTVTSQGNTITSQGSSITNLQNSLNTTNSNLAKKADATALNALQNTVTQQGNSISSQGAQITSLNNQIANKADSSALSSLQSTVNQQGGNISSQGSRITSLENTVTIGDNIVPNSTMLNNAQGWGGTSVTIDGYPGVYSSSSWSPSSPKFNVTLGDIIDFSIMCKADAAINSLAWGIRFDGPNLNNQTSYVGSANYSSGDKKLVTGTITVPSGATTGQLQPNSGAGIGLTIYNVDVTRRNSGVMANSSAINLLTNKVTTQGDTITSQGNSITTLTNGLKTTNDNVSKKADASALESLSNKVTSQGNSISSQGNSITSLQNSIDATNKNVAAKADASALNSLTTKVNSQGDTISSQGSSITTLNANLNRRTVFTIRSQGNGASGGSNVSDQNGVIVASVGRSYGLIVFQSNSDGHTSIKSSKTYDVFNSSSNGDALASDIKALDNGTYAAIITYDEPNQNKGSINSAIELLGGTTEVINSLVYRGAYILLGRKGMLAGDGLELKSPTGGDSSAVITTSVEFINGIMQGLGAAGGVMIKADANANAISSLSSTVTSQGNTITSQGTAITNLNNSLATTNANVAKKADITALNTLSSTVTAQGNAITSQGVRVTSLEASLSVGDNLVPNPDMLNNAQGWSFRSVGVMNGQPYVQSTGGDGWNPTTPKFSVAEGDVLDVSFMARMTKAANGIGWAIRFDGDGWTNKTVSVSSDNYAAAEHKSVSGSVTAPAGANTAYLQPGQAIPSDNDLMLWDVRITRRSQADSANAKAIDTLTNTVSSQGNSISSLSTRATALENSIKNKADASAVSSLQNTVASQGNTINNQGTSITNLTNSVNQIKASGPNIVLDGSFENFTSTTGILITDGAHHSGTKAAKFRRTAATNSGGNNDLNYGGWFDLRSSQVLYVEIWVRYDNASATQNGYAQVGVQWQNPAGTNSWPSAFRLNMSDIPTDNTWKKFSGYVTVGSDAVRGTFWMSIPQNAANLQNTSFLIDDIFVGDATDGYNAQATANAAASAVSSLQNTVSSQGNTITSQSTAITNLQNSLTTTNNKVNTKADSTALSSLSTTVTSQGNTITAQGKSIDSLNTSVGSNSASIKTTQTAVSSLQTTVNATWSLKVQTDSNGNKTIAGIGLSADSGTGSRFLVQADQFAVITGTNGKVASPFVVQNGQTYIQSAFIADASITSAKVGDLQSTNYVSGSAGWRISKIGGSEFNNVIVRGQIQADSGTLNNVTIAESCTINGTLSAQKIVGDVGDCLINATEFRNMRVGNDSSMTGVLATFQRRPYDYKVGIIGGLNAKNSVPISYINNTAVYLLVNGDGSGSGSFVRILLGDQELFKKTNPGVISVPSFSFTVPAGSGSISLTYECRNESGGGGECFVEATYHVFTMRNSSVITK